MIKAVVFDYGRTLLDRETNKFFPEAFKLLADLKQKGYKLGLVSKTKNTPDRAEEIVETGLADNFDAVITTYVKKEENFRELAGDLDIKPSEMLIVGDRIRGEIVIGNKIGSKTVWLKKGLFAKQPPRNNQEKPTYTINELAELSLILNKL